MTRLAVLISGNGSNLQAILDAVAQGRLQAQVALVVSDRPGVAGIARAEKAGVPVQVLPCQAGEARPDYDRRLTALVRQAAPDLVVLAGWRRLLTMEFLGHFRVINLHPARSGQFPGLGAIERAFAAYQRGELQDTGVMVHWVPDEGVDCGPVILEEALAIEPEDSLESLTDRIHALEHRLLVQALSRLSQERC